MPDSTSTLTDSTPPTAPPRRGSRERVAGILLTVALVVLVAIALRIARTFMFASDEWNILTRYVDGGYLTPYNGHLSLIPVAIYQALAHTIGVGSYLPYLLVSLAVYVAVPVTFHLTHRRTVDPLVVAVAAIGIAWSWAAEGNVLYAFLMNFNLPLVMLFGAWWLIRQNRPGADWWAVGAVTVALASSSVGVLVAFAVIVELVFARAPLRRLLRFVPPVALWVTWWVFNHDATKPATFGERASYAWHLTVAILSGFTLGWKPGAVLTAAVVVVVLSLARRRGDLDAHVLATLATLAFFVALSAFSRAGDIRLNPPDAARYVWLGDVLIIAALIWCVRGRRIPARTLAAVAVVVAVGGFVLVGHLRDHGGFVVDDNARTRPFLVAAEAAGPAADPSRVLPLNMIPVTVGDYLGLVDRVGSPVAGVGLDDLGNPKDRRAADGVLIDEENITARVDPTTTGCPPGVPATDVAMSGPVRVDPGSSLVIVTGADETIVTARRFAPSSLPTPIATIPADTRVVVALPVDRSTLPWFIAITDPTVSATRCGAPPGGGDGP